MQLCFRVGEQPARKVETQADAVESECELPRVESVAKVSFNNGLLAHSPDTIDPDLLMIDEKKVGRKALCRDGHASDFQTVLLNTAPSDALQRALVKARSQIVVVS